MALTKVSTGMIETGTASVDLDIDSGTLYIDVTNGRVGVSNSSPATALDVTGTATATLFSGSGASLTNIPNVALDNSSITINSQLTALGGSVTLSTSEVGEGTRLYYTDARARGAVSASGDLSYNSSTGVMSFTERTNAEVRGLVSAGGNLSYNSSTGVFSYTQPTNISTFTNDSSYITNATASLNANKITAGTFDSARIPAPVNGDWWNNGFVRVQTDGIMEAGKYLDFHTADSGGGTDYDVRVTASSGAIDIDGDLTVDDITAAAISATSYSGTLLSSVTGTTQTASDNSTKVATTAYVDTAVSGLVDSAPGTLNTLNELAAALGDDANFSTTVTNSIATKLPLAGGALTGAVTTNSTFDGRNVSVDGAKLDGIETGATADQTAAEILTAIKTVDGSGSGLDADLLDGNESTFFADKTNEQTFNAPQSINGGTSNGANDATLYVTATNNNDWGLVVNKYNASASEYGLDLRMGASSTYAFRVLGNAAEKFRINGEGQAYYQSTSPYWHSANDGSGSGLDADLLDGIDSTSFLRSDAADTATGALEISTGTTRPLKLTTSSASPWAIELHRSDLTNSSQVFNSGSSWYFQHNITIAGSTNWHAGNDGAASGLDADLLDGYDTSSSATASTVVVRDGSGHIYGNYILGSYFNASSGNSENPTIGQIWTQNTGDNYLRKSTPAHFISQLSLLTTSGKAADSNLLDGLDLHTGTNNEANKVVRTDGNGYINAGWINTISGDNGANVPDRVYASSDGYLRYYDLASFRARMNVTAKTGYQGRESSTSDTSYWVGTMGWDSTDFNTLFDYGSGSIESWGSPPNAPSGTSHWVGSQHLHYSNGTNRYGHQIVVGSGSPSLMYVRGVWGGAFSSWYRIWNSANDGSGSGLDADLLDGQHGSYYAPASTALTTGSNVSLGTVSCGALTVTGAITATGNITAYFSDERFKTKTRNIENPLEKVQALSGFMFVENELARSLGYKNDKEQVALSAQEVQAVLPEAVSLAPIDMKTNQETGEITSKSGENYLTVDYAKLVPLLVEAIKELKDEVDELKKRIK